MTVNYFYLEKKAQQFSRLQIRSQFLMCHKNNCHVQLLYVIYQKFKDAAIWRSI